MRKINIDERIILVLVYIFFMIFLLKIFNLKMFELVVYATSFPLVLMLFIRNFKNFDKKVAILIILLIIFSVCNVFFNSLISYSTLSLGYFKKLFMFNITVIFMSTMKYVKIDNSNIRKHIKVFNTFLTFILLFMFIFKKNEMYLLNGLQYHSLVFNFSNPNLTALFLLGMFVFQYVFFVEEKDNKFQKFLLFITSSILIYFIYLTDSRTQFLSALVLIVLCIFYKKTNILKNKASCILFSSFPLLFLILYMNIINNSDIIAKITKISIFEEALDSRVSIWNKSLKLFYSSPILGVYNLVGAGQLHNTHLDVLVSYGILPLILLILIIAKLIKDNEDISKYCYMYGFIALIMSGNGEAALFSGSGGLYIIFGLLLLFTRSDKQNLTY